MPTGHPPLELTVTDLKQWSYCPRIPFYRYVLPVDYVRTYKMKKAKASQAAVEALERRRRLRQYHLLEGKRLFDVWLRSEDLGLAGKPDLLIVTATACFPVDFKDTEGGVRQNHREQIAAYALLASERFERAVPEGFVYLIPTDDIVRVPVTADDRSRVVQHLTAMREMIRTQEMPAATPVRSRCDACEYRNYCGDVW